MSAEEVASKTGYELLQQMVEGTGNAKTLYADRLAALAELNARRVTYGPTCDRDSEEFAIYRVRGAVACYDFKECTPAELRVVVRWCVNRFKLNLALWWADEDFDIADEYGGEG